MANESQPALKIQREQLQRLARFFECNHLAYYEDIGVSGLSLDRPGLRQMEAGIQAGEVDVVLVRDISRIGRDMAQTQRWISDTTGRGVEILTPAGRLEPFTFHTGRQ